jgi:protein-tyrosine phosphatase
MNTIDQSTLAPSKRVPNSCFVVDQALQNSFIAHYRCCTKSMQTTRVWSGKKVVERLRRRWRFPFGLQRFITSTSHRPSSRADSEIPSSNTMASPPWLTKAVVNPEYWDRVLSVLTSREGQREQARDMSRHKDLYAPRRVRQRNPSVSISHLPKEALQHYSVEIGSRSEHLRRNRYYQLEPYDRTRVTVSEDAQVSDEPEGRYLNANWVRELHGGKWWIASQAPLPNTAHAFLSIMMQPETRPPKELCDDGETGPCRVRTVVQLTNAEEGGRIKAHPYFPSEVGESIVVPSEDESNAPSLRITLQSKKANKEAHCIQSTVQLVHCTDDGELIPNDQEGGVTFSHMLYTAWPDFGVPSPEDRASLLAFIRFVHTVNRDSPPGAHPDPPMIVGCSAGVGRTGSFISLCSLLRSSGLLLPCYPPTKSSDFPPLPPSPLGPLPPEIQRDLAALEIDSLREQRVSMVQRPEQQLLVYELLHTAFLQAPVEETGGAE